jgi:hypothetical protein
MSSDEQTSTANTTEEQNRLRSTFWAKQDSAQRLHIDSAEQLWDWLGNAAFTNLASWPLAAGDNLFFRGQSDINYGLTTSLYRQIRAAKPDVAISELDLSRAEAQLLDQMKKEGLGRHMTDFDLVTVLQHHMMPTRLLDVSRTPMEALYFAVESNHAADGVFFMLNPHGNGELDFGAAPLPWGHFRANERYGDSRWTNRVEVAQHKFLDPRMTAQNGTFLIGGLFRSYSGVTLYAGDELIPREMRTDLMTLSIKFLKRKPSAPTSWGANGWVLRIPAAWKRGLLQRLGTEHNITKDTMYPAYTEVARLARHVVSASAAT